MGGRQFSELRLVLCFGPIYWTHKPIEGTTMWLFYVGWVGAEVSEWVGVTSGHVTCLPPFFTLPWLDCVVLSYFGSMHWKLNAARGLPAFMQPTCSFSTLVDPKGVWLRTCKCVCTLVMDTAYACCSFWKEEWTLILKANLALFVFLFL